MLIAPRRKLPDHLGFDLRSMIAGRVEGFLVAGLAGRRGSRHEEAREWVMTRGEKVSARDSLFLRVCLNMSVPASRECWHVQRDEWLIKGRVETYRGTSELGVNDRESSTVVSCPKDGKKGRGFCHGSYIMHEAVFRRCSRCDCGVRKL